MSTAGLGEPCTLSPSSSRLWSPSGVPSTVGSGYAPTRRFGRHRCPYGLNAEASRRVKAGVCHPDPEVAQFATSAHAALVDDRPDRRSERELIGGPAAST